MNGRNLKILLVRVMEFSPPLQRGFFIRRYKRFFVDATLENGDPITLHCPNTGSMMGLLEEGNPLYFSKSDNQKRTLPYTLEMIESKGVCVGVNTQNPNKLVRECLEKKLFPSLSRYDSFHPEVKIDEKTRLDFALTASGLPTCYLEVKNVHLKKGDTVFFPDAVTTRGQKHIRELVQLVQTGNRAVMIYVIQRNDVEHFDFADFIDPTYAKLAREAKALGVEFLVQTFSLSPYEIVPDKALDAIIL